MNSSQPTDEGPIIESGADIAAANELSDEVRGTRETKCCVVGGGPAGVMLAYLLGVVAELDILGRSDEMKRAFASWLSAGTVAVILAVALVFYGPQRSEDFVVRLPHLQNQLEAARWLEANTEPEARIGSFNTLSQIHCSKILSMRLKTETEMRNGYLFYAVFMSKKYMMKKLTC